MTVPHRPDGDSLKSRTHDALGDSFLRNAVRFTADRLRDRKHDSSSVLGDWEQWRTQARDIRNHTIAHLDYYLNVFTDQASKNGTKVHFASDAQEARKIFLDIVRSKSARMVAKSKSMVSEEIHINAALEAENIECVETDLGEWIVQLAHETPSHIIIPAIHKNRYQVQDLFEKESGETLSSETTVLAGYARRALRAKFEQAEIGMTGCNFAIAETGSIVTFSNEGNARMVSTLPKTHIVMMGMERIIPSYNELEVMANVLPRSATGQKTTVYVSAVTGPRRESELDGPDELHVIILDNGRSKILEDPEFREVLNCIRCGACLNVCPVYRQIGGHAYGSVYSGPIGAVITPLLNPGSEKSSELPFASSLCGACHEACPVKIPLHDMLVHLRRKHVKAGRSSLGERAAYAGFGVMSQSSKVFDQAGKAGRWIQLNMIGNSLNSSAGNNAVDTLVRRTPVYGWTKYRDLPKAPALSFRDLWKRGKGGQNEGKREERE